MQAARGAIAARLQSGCDCDSRPPGRRCRRVAARTLTRLRTGAESLMPGSAPVVDRACRYPRSHRDCRCRAGAMPRSRWPRSGVVRPRRRLAALRAQAGCHAAESAGSSGIEGHRLEVVLSLLEMCLASRPLELVGGDEWPDAEFGERVSLRSEACSGRSSGSSRASRIRVLVSMMPAIGAALTVRLGHRLASSSSSMSSTQHRRVDGGQSPASTDQLACGQR